LIPRSETFVESVARDIELTVEEAQSLVALGRSLAASTRLPVGEERENGSEPSLIRCTMTPKGRWRVLISDAVGLVAVGDLRILVEPKIPRSHLFYLFGRSGVLPRVAPTVTSAAEGDHLWELLCRWLLDAVERVLRRDLIRGYFAFRGTLPAARGQIDAIATAHQYYGGNLGLTCVYEEFGADTELNRVLKAAAQAVTVSIDASPLTRRRAARITARMEDVGPLRTNDLRTRPDRRTAHYEDALLLARAILMNVRRTLEHGSQTAWTFLIRTPELVESGVRRELQDLLPDGWRVRKEIFPLRGANMSVAPDLVLGCVIAIGDVKYKRVLARWRRADLYEVTAFATAAGVPRAAVIEFRGEGDPDLPPTVAIGNTQLQCFAWEAREDIAPDQAAALLATTIENWLPQLDENLREAVHFAAGQA
jgi:5-methylcytosine-specific restriction enzyme subunit McrC